MSNSKNSTKKTKRKLPRIDFNSPVILTLFSVSLLFVILNAVLGDALIPLLGCRFTRWSDPLMYIRLITHTFVHGNLAHFAGNFLLLLVVGPMLEEKYGSSSLVRMFLITAAVTGLINIIFFRNVVFIGASGLVFMAILLASFANIREGRLPLTVLLVGVLYIGQEIVNGIFTNDNISQLAHILGGVCGAAFGYEYHVIKSRKNTN